jgi:hypothetical protein
LIGRVVLAGSIVERLMMDLEAFECGASVPTPRSGGLVPTVRKRGPYVAVYNPLALSTCPCAPRSVAGPVSTHRWFMSSKTTSPCATPDARRRSYVDFHIGECCGQVDKWVDQNLVRIIERRQPGR